MVKRTSILVFSIFLMINTSYSYYYTDYSKTDKVINSFISKIEQRYKTDEGRIKLVDKVIKKVDKIKINRKLSKKNYYLISYIGNKLKNYKNKINEKNINENKKSIVDLNSIFGLSSNKKEVPKKVKKVEVEKKEVSEQMKKILDTKEKIKLKTLSLTRGLKTDEEKILVIYKYLSNNLKYNYESLKYWNGKGLSNEQKIFYSKLVDKYNDPFITFDEKEGVCGGISKLFDMMLDFAGIKGEIIGGHDIKTLIPHSWNKIDGKFYDITYEITNKLDKSIFRYYGLHTRSDILEYGKNISKHKEDFNLKLSNYFGRNSLGEVTVNDLKNNLNYFEFDSSKEYINTTKGYFLNSTSFHFITKSSNFLEDIVRVGSISGIGDRIFNSVLMFDVNKEDYILYDGAGGKVEVIKNKVTVKVIKPKNTSIDINKSGDSYTVDLDKPIIYDLNSLSIIDEGLNFSVYSNGNLVSRNGISKNNGIYNTNGFINKGNYTIELVGKDTGKKYDFKLDIIKELPTKINQKNITLEQSSEVNIKINNNFERGYMFIYDSNYNIIFNDWFESDYNNIMEYLEKGIYYIEVIGEDTTKVYDYKISIK